MTAEPTTIKLLLIDDDPLDREAVMRFVAREGLAYDVEKFGSCAEAREYASTGAQADVALVDYDLPDGDGFELLELFKKHDIPVVFVTGNGNEEVAVRAMRAGAADYLIKDTQRNYLHMIGSTVGKVITHQWVVTERDKLLKDLQRAVDTLLPICGRCSKIRDDKQYWEGVERFIAQDALKFQSYGLCPVCTEKTEEETLGAS